MEILKDRLDEIMGGNIDIKMVETCHSTDQNEIQRSSFVTEEVDRKT